MTTNSPFRSVDIRPGYGLATADELTGSDIGRPFVIIDGAHITSGVLVDVTQLVKMRRARDSYATAFHVHAITLEYGTHDGGNFITVTPHAVVQLGPRVELPAGATYIESDA
jgi:hypothetical protein